LNELFACKAQANLLNWIDARSAGVLVSYYTEAPILAGIFQAVKHKKQHDKFVMSKIVVAILGQSV
jgi:hypothetical protein